MEGQALSCVPNICRRQRGAFQARHIIRYLVSDSLWADTRSAVRSNPLLITAKPRPSVGRDLRAMLMHKDAPIGRDTALKAVVWLKRNFGREIEEAVKGTAYSVDTICGIACQETAYFWANIRERLTPEQICARCVLDACGDAPGTTRKAFPRNTSAFRKEYGDERTDMLIAEANKTRALRGYAPKEWIYKGYGIFQYDLQFVKTDPEFFFLKQWYNFSACLNRVMRELHTTWKRHGDLFEAIRAYNGSGTAAAVYAQNVVAYSGFAGEITDTMLA